MMKLILIFFVAAAAADLDSQWAVFKATYKKTYTAGVEQIRKSIWAMNTKTIEEHNVKYAKGLSTFYMRENKFMDLTSSEFVRMNGSPKKVSYDENKISKFNVSLPDSVDWRKKGYVTEVKNQNRCGSCWAFSATGSIEGQHFKATGKLVSLSESNLVDCSRKYGNDGCNGGYPDFSFKYVIDNGIDTEASYPYVHHEERCSSRNSTVGAKMSSYQDVEPGSELALQKKIATIGPISVLIDASHRSFGLYGGGVYYEPKCTSTDLDHAVLAVGYGTHKGSQYYMIKNSWGKGWGLDGYIMMSRNKENNCGIASAASYPIVD